MEKTKSRIFVGRADVVHPVVAKRLDINNSSASRMRTGARVPSYPLMVKVEQEYGWDCGLQVHAAVNGTYANEFERVLADEYGLDTSIGEL